MLEKLESMSRSELIDLQQRVEIAIKDEEKRRYNNAVKAAQEAAQSFGYKLEDIIEKAPKGRSKPVPAIRYCHPDDHSKTWCGLGRRPFWLENELKAGKAIEDFAIA